MAKMLVKPVWTGMLIAGVVKPVMVAGAVGVPWTRETALVEVPVIVWKTT